MIAVENLNVFFGRGRTRNHREKNLTYILVSHDLAVVSHMCNRLLVMNRGKTVETITRSQLRSGRISEKYTKQLLVAGKGYDRAAVGSVPGFPLTLCQRLFGNYGPDTGLFFNPENKSCALFALETVLSPKL